MTWKPVVRIVVASAFAVGLAALATPASAQTLIGRVVDAEDKPVPDAELVFEYVGDVKIRLTTRSNREGDWSRAGMKSPAGGHWNVTVTKGDLGARLMVPALGEVREAAIPPIVLVPGGAAEPPSAAETAEEAALQKVFSEVNASMAANNFDAAIATLNDAISSSPKCAQCYLRLGDAYQKKSDMDSAEKAYRSATEADPALVPAYEALVTLYNQQRRYEEAGQMIAKVNELRGGAGGGDATSSFNEGVILWNQGKIPEAKVAFERALKLNPKMAEAYYYFGMSLVNEGQMAEARKALEQYLTLAPLGPNAPTAKSVLDSIQ